MPTTISRTRVGPNLYKQVALSGAGSWALRYQIRGRERWMGLGSVAVFSLREAQQRARAAQQQIFDGIDPIDARCATLASEARKAALTVSFEAAAQQFYDQHRAKWGAKSRTAFLNTMRDHVYPVFGQTAVADIDVALVLRAIEPLWLTKHVTAGRVRGRIEAVLSWAAVRGFRPAGDNPARWENHLDQLLPVGGDIGEVTHHAALAYGDVPGFVGALRQRKGIAPLALEFLILAAARSGEVVKAEWSEIDFDAKVWTRPADHMKARIAHSIPLSSRAVEILRSLPPHDDGLIFGTAGRPLGKNAMPKLVATMGADCTVHGFRSSFRDWAGETTNFPRELAEHALAHGVGGKVEQAYARGRLVEKRRRLMTSWEEFVAAPAVRSADVTPIRRKPNSAA